MLHELKPTKNRNKDIHSVIYPSCKYTSYLKVRYKHIRPQAIIVPHFPPALGQTEVPI